jgi:DNA repair exonuclease SbcCD nuclease subunit
MGWLVSCEGTNRVHIIAGNHDIIRTGKHISSAVDLVDVIGMRAKFYKDVTVYHDGYNARYIFVPYRDKRMYDVETNEEGVECLLREINEAVNQDKSDEPFDHSIVIGHLSLKGALNITDEITDSLNEIFVPPGALKAWGDQVIMGHIHHPQHITSTSLHVGSMDRSDFSVHETDIDKRVILIDDGKLQSLPLPTRNLRHVEVDVPLGKDSTDFAINSICLYDKALPIKDAIVRLDITLGGEQVPNVDRAKVEDYIYTNLEAHHICNFSESRKISSIEIDQDKLLDNSMDVLETVDQFAETQDFDDDNHKARFKNAARECYSEYQDKQAKKTK